MGKKEELGEIILTVNSVIIISVMLFTKKKNHHHFIGEPDNLLGFVKNKLVQNHSVEYGKVYTCCICVCAVLYGL